MLISTSSFTREFDYKIYDYISTNFDREKLTHQSSYTILVDIDEKSLKELGQWPWPRVIMADLLKKINLANPATIGLDIIFPEQDRTSPYMIENFYKKFFNLQKDVVSVPKSLSDNDALFATAIDQTAAVLSVALVGNNSVDNSCKDLPANNFDEIGLQISSYKNIICNTHTLQESAKAVGFVNSSIDSDGVLRRVSLLKKYKESVVPSLELALLEQIDSDVKNRGSEFAILDHSVKTDKDGSFLLTFYPDSWYKKISAVDIFNGNYDKTMLQGKIVIVGSSSLGLHDSVITNSGVRTIGSKVHMTAIDNIMHNQVVTQPVMYKYIGIFVSTIFTLLMLYLLIINKDLIMVASIGIVLFLYASMTFFMLQSGVYISVGYFYLPFTINFMFISLAFFVVDSYRQRLYVEELDRSHVALLDSMVHVAEVHDIETGAHIIRTKKYIKLLAEYIYKQEKHPYHKQLSPHIIEMMYRTAPLHDIGKVGIPDSVLKKEGKLTFIEFEVMKTHPDLGRHIIKNAMNSYEENDFFKMAINIAYTHHEKWDGSGYPVGLEGESIPLEGRFMAIADVYDALVNARVYKKAFSYEKAYKIIREGRGIHFDPLLVDAFFEIKEDFGEIAELYSDDYNR